MNLKDMTQADIISLLNDVVPGTHSHSRIVVHVPAATYITSHTKDLCTITKVGDDSYPETEVIGDECAERYKVSHFWEMRPGFGAGGVQHCKTRKELVEHVRELQASHTLFEAENQKREWAELDAAEKIRNAECSQS